MQKKKFFWLNTEIIKKNIIFVAENEKEINLISVPYTRILNGSAAWSCEDLSTKRRQRSILLSFSITLSLFTASVLTYHSITPDETFYVILRDRC